MPPRHYGTTLRLKMAFGRTLWFSLVIAIVVLAAGESLLRLPRIQDELPPPSLGIGFRRVEEGIYYLDALVQQEGQIDCLFMGSSLVQFGLDPRTFSQGYQAETGQPIRCFNFGVWVLTAPQSASLAEVLIDRYHPRLLIVGLSTFEFQLSSQTRRNQSLDRLPQTAWAKAVRGEFSPGGWLTLHSAAYRYSQSLSLALQTPDIYFTAVESKTVDGYQPAITYLTDVATFPYTRSNFQFADDALAGLEALAALDSPRTRLLMVEMPTYDASRTAAFGSPENYQRQFLDPIAQRLGAAKVPFWQTSQFLAIPEPFYWTDPLHLHILGSVRFSYWLGQQVGAAMTTGLVESTSPPLAIGLPQLEMFSTYDLSDLAYADLPDGAVVFNPANDPQNGLIPAAQLGYYLTWIAERYGVPIPTADRHNLTDLLAVLDRMRFEGELDLSAEQQQALTQWRMTKNPTALVAAGIHYLVYTDGWFSFTSEQEAVQLLDPHSYKPIATWLHPVSKQRYFLVEVMPQG